jgi:predicted phosphodiesterase
MKIAVLADIHGNWVALEAAFAHIEAWRPDAVIVAGDVINRGPRPVECLRLVQERQWPVVRGNHEDYVLFQAGPDAPRSGPLFETWRNSYWTYHQLNGELSRIAAMPFQVSLVGPDGREVRVVHASMRGNMDGIYLETPDDLLREQIAPPPAVLCVGHTHRPLIRQVDETLVVNVGSVGMPFDNDRRPGYAQLTWQNGSWSAEIIRLAYDWEAARQAFREEGYAAEAGELVRLIQVEFDQARPHLNHWIRQYEKAVLDGELSLAESVDLYLGSLSV